jgi:hypothetical protein
VKAAKPTQVLEKPLPKLHSVFPRSPNPQQDPDQLSRGQGLRA